MICVTPFATGSLISTDKNLIFIGPCIIVITEE